MQKLDLKFKNTPTDTSLVCSSVNLSLNKEETLSVVGTVLESNSPEENHQQHRAGSDLRVQNIVCVVSGEVYSSPGIFYNSCKLTADAIIQAAIHPLPKGRGFLAAKG